MGAKINYENFLENLDIRLEKYFESFGTDICCTKGCSGCCEKGDYPISDIELEYLIKGYLRLENSVKTKVQNNIKNMKKGMQCPFLISKVCSVYKYRPIICRVHGLAYLCNENNVKLPYCVNNGKNFASSYKNGYFEGKPLKANLDTQNILKGLYKEIRNLYDWVHNI